MIRNRLTSLLIVVGTMAVFAALTAHYYPLLPDRLATHFGWDGTPDGWTAKADFVRSYGIIQFAVAVLTAGAGPLLGLMPSDKINLPNRDYWLSPERRKTTLAFLRGYLNQTAIILSILLLSLLNGIYRANLLTEPHLGVEFLGLFVVFMLCLLLNTVGMIRRFSQMR